MIEGMPQEIKYGSSSYRLYHVVKLDGLLRLPDSAPTITIKDPTGSSTLVNAQTMTMLPIDTSGGSGIIEFDNLSSEFNQGALVTSASGATATIDRVESDGTEGYLYLKDIKGAFVKSEAITDDGDTPGSGKVAVALKGAAYYYDVDASSTSSWDLGENYPVTIAQTIDSVDYAPEFFIDVVRYPFDQPLVTSDYIDDLHPDWRSLHPESEDADWTIAINAAHRKLALKIRSLGNRPAYLVKREELFEIELAYAESIIASDLMGLPSEERMRYREDASTAWSGKGEFVIDSDEDQQVDSDDSPKVMTSRFTT